MITSFNPDSAEANTDEGFQDVEDPSFTLFHSCLNSASTHQHPLLQSLALWLSCPENPESPMAVAPTHFFASSRPPFTPTWTLHPTVATPTHPIPKSALQSSAGGTSSPALKSLLDQIWWRGNPRLASFLASLRLDPSNVLTNQQADRTVDLWQNPSDYDKQPICFRPQYKGGASKRPIQGGQGCKGSRSGSHSKELSRSGCWSSPVAGCQPLHGGSDCPPLRCISNAQAGKRQSDPPVEPGPGLLPENKEESAGQHLSSGRNQAAAGRHQPANPVCMAPPQAVPEVAPPQAVPEVAPPQAVPEVAPPQAVPEVAAPPLVFILPPDTSGTALTKLRFDEPLGPGGLLQPQTTAWYCRKKAEEQQRLGIKQRQYTKCVVIKCRQCGQPDL